MLRIRSLGRRRRGRAFWVCVLACGCIAASPPAASGEPGDCADSATSARKRPRGYFFRSFEPEPKTTAPQRDLSAAGQRPSKVSAADDQSRQRIDMSAALGRRWQASSEANRPSGDPRELLLAPLIEQVLARNRTVEAMTAAWRAARERYPQAVALEDPAFVSMLAPASLNAGIAKLPGNSAGYIVGGAQKLPWFGKRQLRGDVARAEAGVALMDLNDARLQIAELAGLAYFDYFLARQRLGLNRTNHDKLQQYREIARRQYEAALAPQQDVLQADVELAELARQRIELERLERTAIARINTLLHRVPDAYLPAPPARLESPWMSLSAPQLRAIASSRRPDLAAVAAELRAEQARLQLAYKEFYPDFELFGRYDNFWSQPSLRGQVGLNMNVPLYRDKRQAAVREAQWRLARRRAEYEQRVDDVNQQVQVAFERFGESQQTLGLYIAQILPAAQLNVQSALAAYESAGGDFLRLVAAQRQWIVLQERYREAIADYHRRRVELERVVGQPLSTMPPTEEIPPRR